jgi:hypothetical protein
MHACSSHLSVFRITHPCQYTSLATQFLQDWLSLIIGDTGFQGQSYYELMLETECFEMTALLYQTTRHRIPKYSSFHNHRCETSNVSDQCVICIS